MEWRDNVKVYENGAYRVMTDEELEQQYNSIEIDNKDALNEFFSTLASAETTSIAKIRAAAQKFLDNTEVTQ